MKLLLDTHALIWWDSEPRRLSPSATAALQDPANDIQLSVVCVWEIVIKAQLGKLSLRLPLENIVADQLANGLNILHVRLEHALAVNQLPAVHKDPFDWLLIAQAQVERATLVSADPVFADYAIPLLW